MEFVKLISSLIITKPLFVTMYSDIEEEKQCLWIDQIFNIYRELSATIKLELYGPLYPIRSLLHQIDNKVQIFELDIKDTLDIPLLMKLLASPRADGQQRVIELVIEEAPLARKVVKAIEKVLLLIYLI